MTDTFPRQHARTQRFTLGEPRNVTVTSDGRQVLFARSRAGDDPVNCLWVADVASGAERMIADPRALLAAADDADLPPEERARRERLREGAGGITSYAVDEHEQVACFTLAGRLFVADIAAGTAEPVDVAGPVFDPRPGPGGDTIAYVSGQCLRVVDRVGADRTLADEPDLDTVSWGSADFIAAEEMGRYRGFWWSPDGSQIAACRVDEAPVRVWHISNPADPSQRPNPVRYPAAGTANADVSLHLCPLDGGPPVEVGWDRSTFPYLAAVHWTRAGLTIVVQSRDQRDLEVHVVDPRTGATERVWADHDDVWVELVPGTGRLAGADDDADHAMLVMCADRDGARRLVVDGEIVTPPDLQVRSVVSASTDRIVLTANPIDDATVLHVHRWTPAGVELLTDEPGVHGAAAGGDTTIIRTSTLDTPGARWHLPSGHTLTHTAEQPLVTPNVMLAPHGERVGATALLLPHGHDGTALPVLLDPYGGPHAQRVVRSHNAMLTPQWFADQGFAVLVCDGRGTPGRGSAFERAVRDDLAIGVLDDQIASLHEAAAHHPELDLSRVAIRGWSFGGYLAALAVMVRPDVFAAAIAGAPVTEWRLYDTHYTERYLGDPERRPEVYDANSLLPLADRLARPLLLVHGLADDNVVAAHTLQLSAALLAAGRPHEVLPLVGVTHMTPQEIVAENLLLHQLDFLRRALDLPADADRAVPGGA